jgi:hypothetical protein
MRLGIMQPYFLPYIGYIQLIKAVDEFIIYDDVNYIKQGWINRNRMLLDSHEFMFTLPLVGASSFKKINEIQIDTNKYREKFLKTVSQGYKKAPYFSDVYTLLEEIMLNTECNLARFVGMALLKTLAYLGINTKIRVSSEVDKDNNLKAQDKVIDICNRLNTNIYINAIGGKELYHSEDFIKHNIELKFLRTKFIPYKQFKNDFVPSLSILDVMMFNSKEEINLILDNYILEE